MAKMLRWSEDELRSHLKIGSGGPRGAEGAKVAKVAKVAKDTPAKGSRIARAKPSTTVAAAKVAAQEKPLPKRRLSRSSLAIESIRCSPVSGSYESGRRLELTFPGARLLSLNDLLALHHFERIAYRRCWHEVMGLAVNSIVGGPRHLRIFERYVIEARRTAPKNVDLDALSAYFKYAIDGLRYCKVLKDDDPTCFSEMRVSQATGEHCVSIVVMCVEQPPSAYAAYALPPAHAGRCITTQKQPGF